MINKMISKNVIFIVLLAFIVNYFMGKDTFNEEMVRGLRVVVTGASTGIGEQLAYQYARMGAHLVITARREQQLKQVLTKCQEIAPKGTKLYYLPADMSKQNDTKKLIEFSVEKLGGLDQLMLNHAYYPEMTPWTASPKDFENLHKMLTLNFVSLVNLWSEATPHLKESHRGSLGVVSSIAGKLPTAYHAPYSGSKFALDGFFGAIRQELKEENSNVTVTLHVLGYIDTQRAHRVLKSLVDSRNLDETLMKTLVPPAGVKDCAFQMIRSTTLGERELYYSSSQFLILLVKLRNLIPGLAEMLTADNILKKW